MADLPQTAASVILSDGVPTDQRQVEFAYEIRSAYVQLEESRKTFALYQERFIY